MSLDGDSSQSDFLSLVGNLFSSVRKDKIFLLFWSFLPCVWREMLSERGG
jgi:hypothetical protein